MTTETTSTNTTAAPGEYLDAKQGAAYIRISPRHFARLKARGQIPFARLSSHCVRFRRSDLDRMMRRLTVGAE